MLTFANRFSTDDDCYKFLSEIKWPDGHFKCAKCGNTTYHKGRTPYSRRCNRCKYDESVTAGTMFNKLRFPILTAFNIVYRMVTTATGNSSAVMSEAFGIQQKTCLAFKHKVQQAMGAMQQKRLTGVVALGIYNIYNNANTRYFWNKEGQVQYVAIAVEVNGTKRKRGFAVTVDENQLTALIPVIERYVHPHALLFMKEQRGYKTVMMKRYKKITFSSRIPILHKHLEQIREWMNNECGHFSSGNMQSYLDEFHFHFNRHRNDNRNFDSLIRIMAKRKVRQDNNPVDHHSWHL